MYSLKLLSLPSTNLLPENSACMRLIIKFSAELVELKLNLSQICNEIKLFSEILEEAVKSMKTLSLDEILSYQNHIHY